MSSVDNRVVKMIFDNEEFEKKAGTTLDTLDKLKNSLDFSDATKGMDQIEESASGVDFSALAEGVQALQDRFSVMGEFVHNIFMDMVNTAVDTGKRIADALVITPVKEGFSEYELQINAVQTIKASTGESVDTINRYLDELNTYADKTIYSFSDMTQNIGKFTNAGVSLEDAVKAMEGISNEAAVSGANTNEASRAMYNFAQALSAGYVKLIDWKSIETANMSTVEFRQSLIDTAVAMGTVVREGDKYKSVTTNAKGEVSDLFDATANFDDSLQAQWMSTAVLTQTLKNYSTDVREMSDEQKDAYEEQLRGIGYTEEQIVAIEELGKKAFDSAQDVKTFSQLLDTLKEALGSGWTKSWQIVIGDFEEAKAFWTDVNNVLSGFIDQSATARNEMLQAWSDAGGRQALIDSLWNSFNALISVMTPLKEAWDSVFPALKAEQLVEYTNKLKTFTEGLKLNDEQMASLKSTAQRVFGILKNAFDGVVGVGKTVIDILGAIGRGIRNAFTDEDLKHPEELVARFKEFADAIRPSEKALAAIESVAKGVTTVFKALASIAMDAGSALYDGFKKIFGGVFGDGEDFLTLVTNIGDTLVHFGEALENGFDLKTLSEGFGGLADAFVNIWNAIKDFLGLDAAFDWLKKLFDLTEGAEPAINILGILSEIFANFGKAISDFTGTIDVSKIDLSKALDLTTTLALTKKLYDILNNINKKLQTDAPKDWLTSLKDTFESVFKGVGDLLKTFKDSILEVVAAIDKEVKADVFKKVAVSFALIVASLWVLASIDAKKLAIAIAALSALMLEVSKLLTFITGLDVVNVTGISRLASALIKIGAALLILALAVKLIGSMEPQQVSEGLLSVSILLWEMVGVAKTFSKMDKNLSKGAGALITVAIAIRILAGAVKALGTIEPNELTAGLIAVSVLLAELVAAARGLSDLKGLPATALGILVLSVSIKVLASTVKDFAAMDFDKMMNGLLGLAGVLAIVVAAAKGLDSIEGIGKVSVSLVIFAAAIKVLESVVTAFANMTEGQIVQGIVGLIAVMGALVIAAKAMDNIDVKGLLGTVAGLITFTKVIKSIADIAIELSAIPFEQLAVGLGGLALILVGLAAAAAIFSSETMDPIKIQQVSGALVAFSVSIGIMSASLKILSSIPWEALLISLGAIVGLFVIIGGATAILSPLVPAMLSLAGAFALFGVAALAFGAGVGIAAVGLATLVTALTAGGFVLAEVGRDFLSLIEQAGKSFANMFVGFVTTLAEQGPALVEAISTIIQSVLNAISINAPLIVQTLLALLTDLLVQLATYVPQMADAAAQIIEGFLQAVAQHLPQILDSGITIALEFINGISERLPEIIDAGFKLIISFIDGLATAIDENHDELWDAIGHLIKSIVDAIIDGVKKIGDAAGELIFGKDGLLDGLGSFGQEIFDAGANVVQGFIDGLTSMPGQLWNAACGLANDAWNAITSTLDEHSPSRLTYGGGKNFTLGFVNGIADFTSAATDVSSAMAYAAIDAFDEALNEDPSIWEPTISPVLDDLGLQNGIGSISRAFDNINTDAIVDFQVNGNYRNDLLSELAAQNAKSISKALNAQSENNAAMNPSKLNIIVNGVSSPDDVADAVAHKVRLLGLI